MAGASAGSSPAPLKSSWRTMRSPSKESSTMSSIDALTDEPNVVNRATTAVPTISAEALDAMRRGLRIALRRARRPVKPRVALAPAPSTAAAGRATTGPSTTAPTSTPRAPSPAWARAPSPAGRDDGERRRRRRSRRPPIARATDVAERSMATSRSAASGATRDALSAGVTLATSVVRMPTAAAMTIVSVPTTRPAVGRARSGARHQRLAARRPGRGRRRSRSPRRPRR